MGRKPLPAELHEQRGSYKINPQRRKKNPKAIGKPKMPRHLDKYGRDEWKRIVELMQEMGTLSKSDATAIEQYCEAYSDWRTAKDWIKKTGIAHVKYEKNGKPITCRSAFMTIKQQSADRCYRYLVEFGMTPSARSRLQVEAKETESDWFELALKNRNNAN